MSLDHLFGELRAILHHPSPSQSDLYNILETAHHLSPDQYESQWRPHLAGHKLPLFYANNLNSLETLAQLLPDNAPRLLRITNSHVGAKAQALIETDAFQWVTHLNIETTKMDLFGWLASIDPSHRLHTLRISKYMSDLDVITLMHQPIVDGLHSLRLDGYAFHNRGATAIAQSPHMRNLRELYILGDSMGNKESNRDAGIAALTGSTQLQHLQTLDLSHQQLGEPLLEAMREAIHWSSLNILVLARNHLEHANLHHLAQNETLWTNLHTLNLYGNDIFDLTALKPAPCDKLKTLNLAYNELGHSAILDLVEMTSLHQLESLNLAYNNLDAASMQALVKHHQWSNLKSFECHGNPLTSEGVATWLTDRRLWPERDINLSCVGLESLSCFREMQNDLKHIINLYLDENRLTDTAVEALTHSRIWPQLKYVVLDENNIGEAGAEHLQANGHANLCISMGYNDTTVDRLYWDCTGDLEVTHDYD